MPDLRLYGHDVVWCGNWDKDPGDAAILTHAHNEGRILVTLDKDFGELAILNGEAQGDEDASLETRGPTGDEDASLETRGPWGWIAPRGGRLIKTQLQAALRDFSFYFSVRPCHVGPCLRMMTFQPNGWIGMHFHLTSGGSTPRAYGKHSDP